MKCSKTWPAGHQYIESCCFHSTIVCIQEEIKTERWNWSKKFKKKAQSAGAVEYIDDFSAEEYPPNECPGYDTKQFDVEAPVMLELWGMRSTPFLQSLCLHFTVCKQKTVFLLNWIVWNETVFGPVSWGCRIHRLHLWRGIRAQQRVSKIWH